MLQILKDKLMTKSGSGNKIEFLAALGIIVLVWTLLGLKYDFYFVSNDDSLLEAILSGGFSGIPEARDMQHLYPLARLFTLLYQGLPSVPWYGLFLCTAQFFSLFLCVRRCGSCLRGRGERIFGGMVLLFFCTGLTIYELVMVQYTITAAMMAVAAIFLMITDDREEEQTGRFLLHRLPCLLLYATAFALRSEIGLFLLPFMVLGCLYKWLWDTDTAESRWELVGIAVIPVSLAAAVLTHIDFFLIPAGLAALGETVWCMVHLGRDRGKQFLKLLLFGLTLTAVMGVLYVMDAFAYRGQEWKEARAFFDARTEIYDFGKIPAYADATEFYKELGISGEEQMLLENYNFALSDRYDSEVMKSVTAYQKNYFSYLYSKEYLKKTILDVTKRILTFRDGIYCVALVLMYVMVVLGFLLKRKYSGLMMTVYTLAAHMVCWCYLSWKNRLPERVTHGLYLAEIMVLLAMCLQLYRNMRTKVSGERKMEDHCAETDCLTGRLYGFILAFSVGAIGIYGIAHNMGTGLSAYAKVREAEQDWRAVRACCEENPDKLYLLDTLSFASYTERIFEGGDSRKQEKGNLPVQNYTMCGGWAVNTPAYVEKLSGFEIDGSLYTAILSGRNLYFIAGKDVDVSWLERYFNSEGAEIHLRSVDEVSVGSRVKYIVYEIN